MKTEKIAFDFSLWGQEGIECFSPGGVKAKYVGEGIEKGLYAMHLENGKIGAWFHDDLYMTRQVKQKTFEEVVKERATS